MRKIVHNKSLLHRFVAMVMSVVMILTLVAIDSKIHLFAEEEIVVKTIDITNLLRGKEKDVVIGSTEFIKYKFQSKEIDNIDQEKILYTTYTGQKPETKLSSPSDATGYGKMGDEQELSKSVKVSKYAFYYPVYKKEKPEEVDYYKLLGAVKVAYDIDKPNAPGFTLNGGAEDKIHDKGGYYLLNITKKDQSTPVFMITASDVENPSATGIDKVVYLEGDSTKETELKKNDNGMYIFSVPDKTGIYRFKAYDNTGNESKLSNALVIKKINGKLSVPKVSVSKNAVKKRISSLDFLLATEKVDVTVEIAPLTAGDDGTKVASTLEYVFIPSNNDKNLRIEKEAKVNNGQVTFSIPSNRLSQKNKEVYTVAISVRDEFGNRSYTTDLNNRILFVSDASPEVILDPNSLVIKRGEGYPGKGKGSWANSVSIGVAAESSYAYIGSMYYTIDGSDEATVFAKNLNDYSGSRTISVMGKDAVVKSKRQIALADGEYSINIYAKDYIGNVGSQDWRVYIDNTAPDLDLSSDYPMVSMGKDKYYPFSDEEQCVNVAWDDYGMSGVDTSTAKARLVKTGDVGDNQELKIRRNSDGNLYICVDGNTVSGCYNLIVDVWDYAGNQRSAEIPVLVNKDDITASIGAKANGSDVVNRTHISADEVVVTGTATGYGLTKDDIEIELNGDDIKAECKFKTTAVEKTNATQITYTYTISKGDRQGEYEFLTTVHKHGTDAVKKAKCLFVYDVTNPSVKVDKVNPHNRKEARVTWEISDNEVVKNIIMEGTRTKRTYNKETGAIDKTECPDIKLTLDSSAKGHTFTDEGRYVIKITAVDKAGNQTVVDNIKFDIDNENPFFEYTESNSKPSEIDNNQQEITIKAQDAYRIDKDDVMATVQYITYDGTEKTKTVKFERVNNETVKAVVKLEGPGKKATQYSVKVTGTDKAGNKIVDRSNLAKKVYYIDNTKPQIELEDDPKNINDGYYKENISFDIHATEQFDRKHVLTITEANGTDPKKTEKTIEYGYSDYYYGVDYSTEGRYDLKIMVTDAAGNSSSIGTKFVIDKTKPEIQIGEVQKINQGNVNVPVKFTDNIEGNKFTVHLLMVDAHGNKVRDVDYAKGTWKGTGTNKNYAFTEEGDYTITVSAEDKAGNKAVTKSVKFRIDKTAPVISISGVNDRQTTSGTATISVEEAFSFDYEGNSIGATDINVSITKKTDSMAETNIAELTTSSFSAGNPHTATYNFADDGEYTITVKARDLARNEAVSVTKSFKIDSKAPVVKVTVADKNDKTVKSYDAIGSTDVLDPNYVNMSLSVEETFFRTNNVTITVKKDGNDISSSTFTNYSNSSSVSVGSQKFEEDGSYDISVTAQDELGNKADDYNIVFTVDNTAPTVETTKKLQSLMAKSTVGEDGSILLNAADFADIVNSGYEALWNVNDTSVFDVSVKMDGVDFIDFSDMADGYHKITMDAVDEVGHKTSGAFEFTYDGTAPRIIISGVEDGETMRKPFDLTIGLENEEDEITSIVINGNTIDPAQYKSNNQYKMRVEEFDTYTIEVTATDKAGNVSSTVDEKTGAVFTFKLSEKMSSVAIILIIVAAVLLIALMIFVIIAGRKRRKKKAA